MTAAASSKTIYFKSTTAGSVSVAATATSLTSSTKSATVVAAAADYLTIMAGNNQTAARNVAVSTSPQVKVTDKYGNAVSGVSLTFTIATGAGSVGSSPQVTDSSGLASTTWTLGTGAAGAGNNTLTVARQTTALPDVAATGRATVTFTASSTNTAPSLTVPSDSIYPIDGASPPKLAANSAAYTFTSSATDANGDTVTYSCVVQTMGLDTTDPNYIAASTNCTSLASFKLVSSVLKVSTASFSGGVLTWWPLTTQRGVYKFTITADDGNSATDTKSFYVTVRENYTTTNLKVALDASASIDNTGLSSIAVKPRLDGSADDVLSTAWLGLYNSTNATLTAVFNSANPWSGVGTSASPYQIAFNGTNDKFSLSTSLSGMTKMLFSTWVNSSSATSNAKVILSTGGGTGNGFVLKQADLDANKVELQVGQPSYSTFVLRDKPVAYWRLNEASGATTAVDSSGNGYNATYSGTQTLGNSGAIYGDSATAASSAGAATNYIASATGGASIPIGSSSRTVEAWIYPTSLTDKGTILQISSSSVGGGTFLVTQLFYSGNSTYYLISDGVNIGNNVSTAAGNIAPLNAWSHVVFSTAGTTWTYWLNGTQMATGTLGVTLNTVNADVRIGNRFDFDQPFAGRIQEVAIYDYPLTSQQVYNHYQAGKNGYYPANKILAYGPSHYWPMDDAVGSTTATDKVVSGGINLTHTNTPYPGVATGMTDTSRTSTRYVSSNSTYSTTASGYSAFGSGLTILAWVRPYGTPCAAGAGYVLGGGAVNTDFVGLQTWCPAGGDNRVTSYTTSGGATNANCSAASAAFTSGTWYHMAMTVNYAGGANSQINYRNGASESSCSPAAVTKLSNRTLYLAQSSTGIAYNDIDVRDLAIFERVLTATEINDIYSNSNIYKCQSTSTFSNGAWNMLSGLWDGTNLSLFVNGRQECQFAPSGLTFAPSTDFYVGSTASGTNNWQGSMSNLRAIATSDGTSPGSATTVSADYDTQSQKYNMYKADNGDLYSSGLVWSLDAATANKGLSTYSNGTCATADQNWFGFGGTAMGLMNNLLGGYTAGSCGGTSGWLGDGTTSNPYALAFDGTANYVTADSNTAADAVTNTMTLEFWLKPGVAQNGNYRGIFVKNNGSGRGIALAHNVGSATDVYFDYEGANNNWNNPGTGTWKVTLTTGAWNHLVVTKSGTTGTYYLNGALVGSPNAFTNGTILTSTNPIILSSNFWKGSMARVAMYNVALTQAQIRQNCKAMASRFNMVCK